MVCFIMACDISGILESWDRSRMAYSIGIACEMMHICKARAASKIKKNSSPEKLGYLREAFLHGQMWSE